jgi:hypothetical protein
MPNGIAPGGECRLDLGDQLAVFADPPGQLAAQVAQTYFVPCLSGLLPAAYGSIA